MNIYWFRSDLRLWDNVALESFLQNSANIEENIFLWIWDTNILQIFDKNNAKIRFISNRLEYISQELQSRNYTFKIITGEPIQVFQQLSESCDNISIYANADYSPYAKKRDRNISQIFDLKLFDDSSLFRDLKNKNGNKYQVYSDYRDNWKQSLYENLKTKYTPMNFQSSAIRNYLGILQDSEISTLAEVKHIDKFLQTNVFEYDKNRDIMSLDKNSHISHYLKFGLLPTRYIYRKIVEIYALNNADILDGLSERMNGLRIYFDELIWREYYRYIYLQDSYKSTPKLLQKDILWKNGIPILKDSKKQEIFTHFEKWCNGLTENDFVNAGMKELNTTGFMHNRLRMIVASYLIKDLEIDWKLGERYFKEKLLDYDYCSNRGGWLWSAGIGASSNPYFRKFNPNLQQKKFDKDEIYTEKWLNI